MTRPSRARAAASWRRPFRAPRFQRSRYGGHAVCDPHVLLTPFFENIEQGQLIFLAAGDEALFKEAGPQLDVMGKASFFLGATGKGTRMKLVANMVMGTMLAAFSEGMTLADRSGLSKDDMVKILSLGAMANPMFNLKGPKIIADGTSHAGGLSWRPCHFFKLTDEPNLPQRRPHPQLPAQARPEGLGLFPHARQPAGGRHQDRGGRQRCVVESLVLFRATSYVSANP